MRGLGGGSRREGRGHVGGIWIDDDVVTVLVCTGPGSADEGMLRFDREASVSELAATVADAERLVTATSRGSVIDWTVAIGGGDVLHEVVTVPPQVRAFRDVRLEACLAGTSWGSAEAVESAGYRLGHVFDGDRCILGVVAAGALATVAETTGCGAKATSSAAALLELLRAVERGLFEPGAPAAMGLLCGAASVAACVVENGEVRLLYQAGLTAYARELAAASPVESIPDEPLEFEMGGNYSIPTGSFRRSAADQDAHALETGAYQAAVTRVVQDLLGLYQEQYGTAVEFPRRLLLTGEGVRRHAMQAFAVRYLGSQFDVEELDAALVARIDDPETARRFAALQSSFGGALAAVASGLSSNALRFELEPYVAPPTAKRADRARRGVVWSPSHAVAGALALLLVVVGLGARLAFVATERRALAEAIREEEVRREQLSAITAERKQAETKLAHTRELLAALTSMRGRQALPPELLTTVATCLPSGARLDEIELKGAALRLAGEADDREVGMRLALALEQRRDAFADVVPQTDTKLVKDVDPETGEPGERIVYTFAITTRYARNTAAPSERKATGEKES